MSQTSVPPMPQTSVHRDIRATNFKGIDVTTGTDPTDAAHIGAAATHPARIGATAHIGTTDATTISAISGLLFGEPAPGTEHLGCQDTETPTEVGGA